MTEPVECHGQLAPTIIAVVLLVGVIAVAVYDLYVNWFNPNLCTVTQVFRAWSKNAPILPLAIGVVLGHLFWSRTK